MDSLDQQLLETEISSVADLNSGDSTVWVLRQDTPEIMSEAIPSASGGSSSPPPYPRTSSAPRVSFLYPATASDFQNKTPGVKPKLSPKPSVVPPASAPPSSAHRLPTTSWVHSAKQKEEAGALSRAQTSVRKSPERTSFASAVIERTSKLYGDAYKPTVSQSSNGVTHASEASAKSEAQPEEAGEAPVANALSESTVDKACQRAESTEVPSAMLKPEAPEKVRCFHISITDFRFT